VFVYRDKNHFFKINNLVCFDTTIQNGFFRDKISSIF